MISDAVSSLSPESYTPSRVTESVEDYESGIHKVVFVEGARVGEDDTDDANETGCADTCNATTYEEHGHVLGSSAEGGTDQEDDEGALSAREKSQYSVGGINNRLTYRAQWRPRMSAMLP